MKGDGTAQQASAEPSVSRLLLAGFGVSILILLTTAILSTWNHQQLVSTARKVTQTQTLLLELAELRAEILEARDAQRGFIITGENGFLAHYREVTNRLTRILASKPVQDVEWEHLRSLTQDVLRTFDSNIEARRLRGFDAAAEQVSEESVQVYLTPLKKQLTGFSNRQRDQLTHREQRSARAERLAFWFNNSGRVLTILLFAGVFFYLLHENRLRHQQEMELRRSSAELERRVAERTAALRQSQQEILSIADREQRRIGHDLHDSLGQQLTGIEFRLHSLLEDLDAPDLAAQRAALKAELAAIGQMTRETIGVTRSLARGLTPVKPGELGLMEALDDLVQRTRALGGPQCFFECPEPVSINNGQIAGHLFRIAQEAINNALKHSGATRIIVSLLLDGNAVRLSISDNGRGFPRAGPVPGLGLTVMQHRANILAASLRTESSPEGGVVVACRVALKPS